MASKDVIVILSLLMLLLFDTDGCWLSLNSTFMDNRVASDYLLLQQIEWMFLSSHCCCWQPNINFYGICYAEETLDVFHLHSSSSSLLSL